MQTLNMLYTVMLMRYGWYALRKQQGYPISLRRAFFGAYPRFSAYEAHEPGCPDWALRDYKLVGYYESGAL